MRFSFTILFSLLSLCSVVFAQGQIEEIKKDLKANEYQAFLEGKITNYKIVQLDYKKYFDQASEMQYNPSFQLVIDENETWDMQLIPQHHLVENLRIYTPTKGYLNDPIDIFPYSGYLAGNGSTEVRLTIAKDFIYGFWQGSGSNNRFIEPLSNVIPGAKNGLYIVYNGDDVVFSSEDFCASSHLNAKTKGMQNVQKISSVGECYEVDISTASDFLMYEKYNSSVDDLTNHNVGVMNNVQMNYDDEFADELQFQLNEQWISDCSTCDPWPSTLDASDLLFAFRQWANSSPSGFDEIHDIGQLWTDRNIASDGNSGTVGVAYVGAVCGSFRYQLLEDFTSNANFLRVMVAHETGHNFDAVSSSSTGHDPSGSDWIMAPSVSNVSQWSPASISDIEGYYAGISCMAACAPPVPPVAAFSSSLTEICPGTTIQFFDESTSSPTSWSWTFTGGTPSNSSEESPSVTYNTPGVYTVSLEVTNNVGSDFVSIPGYITVSSSGTDVVLADDFSSGLDNWAVSNPDNSTTWESTNVPGSSGEASVAWINNYDYNNGVGDLDGLESAVLDFSGRSNVNLQLEYAYARYNSANSDVFRIKISTNGGASFPTTLFTGQENGSGSFATVSDQLEAFIPTNSSEWCVESTYSPGCINLDLSAYDGQSNIVILLENESDYGNNLYLDNILITSSCQVLNPPSVQFTASANEGCAPLTVQFFDLSGNNPDSWNWSFPGGVPNTSNDQNPVIVYDTKGLYDVSLTASNSAGSSSDTYESFIEVKDVPDASFVSDITGNTVIFTNNSIDGAAYSWSFGDNENSTDTNPIHVYDEDGTYIVELTAFNTCGTATITETITIATLPNASFSALSTSGCAPLIVQFVNESSTNADSYLWTFEGGSPNISTQENPTVVYNDSGFFDVTLTVTNEQGNSTLSLESYINVSAVPEPIFSSFQNGFTYAFTNETEGSNTYLWDFGDTNTSTQENPSHTYAEDGTYLVTLTATNDCGSAEETSQVVVSNLPTAGINASSTNGCVPLTVQFTDGSSSNVDTWNWTFEGGNPSSSNLQNPVVQYNSEGVFDVSLIVTNQEGSDNLFLSNFVTVGVGPSAGFTSISNQLNYSFTNTSTNSSSYLWEFGDNTTSSLENPNHTYLEDGIYTVKLTATNDCGTDIFQTTVEVVSAVEAGMSFSSTSGCADLVVQFSDNSSNNVTSRLWTFEGGIPATSFEQNPTVTYQNAGIFDVSLEVSNSGFTDVIVQPNIVQVDDVPNADFSFDVVNLSVSFNNATLNGNSYSWSFGDNETSNIEDPMHTYAAEGIYEVMLIASNNCGSDTSIVEVNVSSLPTANFSANATNGCTDFTVVFTDLSTSSTTEWLWEFEGGNPSTSTLQNPVVVYENPGIFDVKLTASNDVGSDQYTLSDYITVGQLPSATIDVSVEGITANLSFDSDNYDNSLWTIEGISGSFSNESINVDFPADGDYEVKLTLTNECGTVSFFENVTITAYPAAAFESENQDFCAPAEIQFIDLSEDNVSGWNWTFEGGNPASSDEQNPLVNYNSSGSYPVQLIVNNSFGADTVVVSNAVVVSEEPVAGFEFSIAENTVEFINSSNINGDISWNFGDMATSNEENPTHIYSQTGTYEVTMILDGGANCQDTITQTIDIFTVDIKNSIDFDCLVYPVPARDQFFVEIETSTNSEVELNITNTLGQRVDSRTVSLQNGNNKFHFNNSYPAGLYLITVNTDQGSYLLKLIID